MKKFYPVFKAIVVVAVIALCASTASARVVWASYKCNWYKLDTVNNTAQLYSVQRDTNYISTPTTFSVGTYSYKITSVAPNFASQQGYGNNVTAHDPSCITKFYLSSNVTEVGENAFAGCKNITTGTLGTNMQTIGKCAFKGCESMTSVGSTGTTSSKAVTTIGDSAFAGCTLLKAFTINSAVTSLGVGIFDGCENLKLLWNTASVPESYFYTDAEGYKKPFDGIPSVNFGSTGSAVPKGFMYGNKSLTTLSNTNVVSVGDYAFYGCPVNTSTATKALNLGTKATTIGKYAFAGNTRVRALTINAVTPTIAEGAFYGCDSLVTVTLKATDPATAYANLPFGTSATDKPYQAVLSATQGYEEAYAQAAGTKWFTKQIIAVATSKGGGFGALKAGAPYHYRFTSQLSGVIASDSVLLVKDNNYYYNKDEIDTTAQQAYPYEADFVTKDSYDQSTWIVVRGVPNADECVGHLLSSSAGGVAGIVADTINPVMDFVPGLTFDTSNGVYTPYDTVKVGAIREYTDLNTYIPASFSKQATYFFVQPKPCEYAQVKWALYNNGYCYMPDKGQKVDSIEDVNPLSLEGSFKVVGSYLPDGQQFKDGNIYTIKGIALKASDPAVAAFKVAGAKAQSSTAADYVFLATEIVTETEGPNTAVSDVTSAKTVKAVRYYDLAGRTSAQPFEGVNVVVTTYTDGTTATSKTIK